MPQVLIITGREPDDMVRYAASQLKRYFSDLFHIHATIGPEAGPSEAMVILDAGAAGVDPPADEQAFMLRRVEHRGTPAMIAVGGSARSTMWAVYELVERWGVRYLLHGDVLPEDPGPFHLPDVDLNWAPNLRTRGWRLINDFACGPESWGLEENRRFIDQIAKMKFNEIALSLWPWQSYVHYEFKGRKKKTGISWFGYEYPVDDDTIGKEIFDGARLFENPGFAGITDYDQRHAAAKQQANGIIDHAHRRGITVGLSVQVLEYPLEMMDALPGAQVAHQLRDLTCRPPSNQDPTDSQLIDLVRTVIKAHVSTYPGVDCIYLGMPEHREWMDLAEGAWRSLDAKYGIGEVMSLESAIAAAEKRTLVHGGAKRQVTRVKSDLVTLSLLDDVLSDPNVLTRPGTSPVKVYYSFVAEELLPLVPKLLSSGGGLSNFIDYTARRIVDQIGSLDLVPAHQLPSHLIFTLADDNVGLLPQLATRPLHELASYLRRHNWNGFSTRYWTIGDLDPTTHYLARSSWDENVTPESAYADLASIVCGEETGDLLSQAWQLIEEVTDGLDKHGMSFGFPVPDMAMKHHGIEEPLDAGILADREKYRHAMQLAARAHELSRPAGKTFARYHEKRLAFGVLYIDMAEAVRNSGIAERQGRAKEANAEMRKALHAIRQAIQSYADVAADNSDRGAVAILNEYAYRPIRDKLRSSES